MAAAGCRAPPGGEAAATVVKRPSLGSNPQTASFLVAEVVELALHVVRVHLCIFELALEILELDLNIVCVVVSATAVGHDRRRETLWICRRHVPRLPHGRHISRLRRYRARLGDGRRSHTGGFGPGRVAGLI